MKRDRTINASPRLGNRLSQLAYSGDASELSTRYKNTSENYNTVDNINTIDDDDDYIQSPNAYIRFRSISADKTISSSGTRGSRDMTEMAQ